MLASRVAIEIAYSYLCEGSYIAQNVKGYRKWWSEI